MILRRGKVEFDLQASMRSSGGADVPMEKTNMAETTGMPKKKPTRMMARKPSERFACTPLTARSKASQSERMRVSDLVNKLEQKLDTEVVNETAKFKGYRPGHSGPPG